MDDTDQILRELCDNTRNATIEACCKAVHIACRAEAPNATAQELGEIIIRRLRNLKTDNPTSTNRDFRCDCGAAVEGKWADVHHPSCAALHQIKEIEEIIKHNCHPVEGWPMSIDGIENAAAAIYAKFASTGPANA